MKRKGSIYAFIGETENHFQKQLLYIGVDTTKEQSRVNDHLKPSKIDSQLINKYLQEHENWYSMSICEFFVEESELKEIAHLIESYFIKKHQPIYNKNSK